MWARAPARAGGCAALGTLLLLVLFLAGSFSEDHYLLVAAPCLCATVALIGSPWVAAAALPGLVLLAFPRAYLGNVAASPEALQVRYVLAELLLAVAAAMAVAASMRRDQRDRPTLAGRREPRPART